MVIQYTRELASISVAGHQSNKQSRGSLREGMQGNVKPLWQASVQVKILPIFL